MNYSIKNRFPFRIGCTSYVYPDRIVPNVEKMSPVVDDIALVLYESAHAANIPGTAEIEELRRLARQFGVSYTVHFPIDLKAGSADAADRKRFLDTVLGIIDITSPLKPLGYALHLEGIERGAGQEQRKAWENRCEEICGGIAKRMNGRASSICVENLSYPQQWHEPLITRFGFGHCLDIGHLRLYEPGWRDLLAPCVQAAGIIHLHGVCDGKDHSSLREDNECDVGFTLETIRAARFCGCLTLEVFGADDTFSSLEVVSKLWHW